MITLTESAKSKIKSFYDGDPEISGKPLRIGIQSGGCAGFTFVLGISEKGENDNVYQYDGFEIVVDQNHLKFLEGIKVDYVETLTSSGFKFDAPKSTGGCGCGKSACF